MYLNSKKFQNNEIFDVVSQIHTDGGQETVI